MGQPSNVDWEEVDDKTTYREVIKFKIWSRKELHLS
jgi:hypothetical protein